MDQPGGQVPVPDADHPRGVERQVQPFLAQRQALLGLLQLGDVAADRDQPLRLAIRAGQRRDHHIPPFGRALMGRAEALESADAAGAGRRHRGFRRRMVGAGPHPQPGQAEDGLRIAHFHGGDPARADEQGVAVEVEHHDAVAAGLQDEGVEGLGLAQRRLGLPRRGAVAQDLDVALDGAVLVAQRHHLAAGPEAGAVVAQVPAFVVAAAVMEGGLHLGLRHAGPAVLGGEEQAGRPAGHFRLGPAEDAPGTLVPGGHQAVAVERDDGVVGGALEQGFEEPLAGRAGRRLECLIQHGSAATPGKNHRSAQQGIGARRRCECRQGRRSAGPDGYWGRRWRSGNDTWSQHAFGRQRVKQYYSCRSFMWREVPPAGVHK